MVVRTYVAGAECGPVRVAERHRGERFRQHWVPAGKPETGCPLGVTIRLSLAPAMRLLLTLFTVGIFVTAFAFASIMALYAYYARDLPDPGALSHRQLFQTARVLDRTGKLLQELNDPQGGRRTLVSLTEIPRVARDATIAAEDASFYERSEEHTSELQSR